MSGRIDKLVKLFWDKRPLKRINGNGVSRMLKDKNLMKWLLLAGVQEIKYENGKFIDNYKREIVFYECGFYVSFYIKGGEVCL